MVKLCCTEAVANQFKDGDISFVEACRTLNKYTTTLHGALLPLCTPRRPAPACVGM